jgi:hypothetical protein
VNARSFANVAGRNGGFEVWQGGPSVALPASSLSYTLDGWYLSSSANQAATISRQAGLTNGSSFSCRVQRNSGQTGTAGIGFGFPLDTDELKKMAGQSVILQFTVSTGANWSPTSGTLTAAVVVGTGASPVKYSSGSYVGAVTEINFSNNLAQGAGAATFYSAIVAIPSNIGQAEIQFQWTPVGTAGANDWFQIDDVSLSVVPAGISAIKPAFERSDFIWDLQRCQRHYEKSYDYGIAPGTISNPGRIEARLTATPSRAFLMAHFKQTKRATPIMTGYSPVTGSSGVIYDGIIDISIASFTAGTNSAAMESNAPSNGDAYMHWVADARI